MRVKLKIGKSIKNAMAPAPKHVNERTISGPSTEITVYVYKIVDIGPIWHTGTAIGGAEYYFHSNNRVLECLPGEMQAIYGRMPRHRKINRTVRGDMVAVLAVLEQVKSRWNGSRYDLASHNCNYFTDDLLKSLGSSGLDREYLKASGLATFWSKIPGGATTQELLKILNGSPKIDQALKEDLRRFVGYYFPGVSYSDAAKQMEKLGSKFRKGTSKIEVKAKQEAGKLAEKGKSGIKSLQSKIKSSMPKPAKPKLPSTSSVGKTVSSAAKSVAKAPQNAAKKIFGKKKW